MNFKLLKLPVFWIAFFYNSAAYAAPKADLSAPLINLQLGDKPLNQAEGQRSSPSIDRSIVGGSTMPLVSQMAPPEMIQPRAETLPETNAPASAEDSEVAPAETGDAELGILRLREQELQQTSPVTEPPASDSTETDSTETDASQADASTDDLTGEQADDQTEDSELGILRLREQELERIESQSASARETVYFIGRLSFFKSDNILLDRLDPIDDQLISLSASVLAAPSLGPDTLLIASVEGGLIHYNELSELDYRELEFRASLRQFFSARTYGEIGWSNQQLFDDGDRFFNDHSLRLTLARRDPLASNLRLDSFYQLRLSFADPSDRNRIINTLGIGLNYDLQPDLSVGLDYQFTLTDFTQQDRDDLYNQVVAQLSYDLSRNSRIILFGGFSFGDSSDSDVDFNSAIFGASIDVNVPLF
ncbi:MAG: outer membrane beta-barrel protein [Leptolyngbyaceae cyanobacterium SL_5_9]|nr:outer membrane beta-barrel protein [Leptolyngbyaceae cyanobacterium SL_5_9]NJO76074.1 outer membrane beta-barrel protein [Leptolyngbyaceae cyanobacterium RM1_406_9]